MKRRCMMCQQRKQCDIPVGGGYLCDKCGVNSGVHGRLKNVAEENSRKWQGQPCKHQSITPNVYRRHRSLYQRGICDRCKVTVYDIRSGPARTL